jgi:hypothetical protein
MVGDTREDDTVEHAQHKPREDGTDKLELQKASTMPASDVDYPAINEENPNL